MSSPRSFQAPPGTRDLLPPESSRWERFLALVAHRAELAGFGLIHGPLFEDVGVFARVGEGTDVVTKEMYEFVDRGDRHLALRPESTASVCRAYAQHRPTATPWKVWYASPHFRYEKAQAGRYRQHHQVGIEALGSSDPDLDVEVIGLAWSILRGVGLQRVLLLVNSMGDPSTRVRYSELLQEFLRDHLVDIDPADRDKIDTHPLRVLDSKRPATQAVTGEAPRVSDSLTPEAAEHFARVQSGLGELGVPFAIEPRLVRGLDYYTHTTFEFQSSALESAQSTVCGGGRYDGLVAQLGGPDTPGIGFGMGIERMLLAADAEGVFGVESSRLTVFVVDVTGGAAARRITHELREAGISAERSFDQRSMRSQMKQADKSGARVAIIVGEVELAAGSASVRNLRGEADQVTVPLGELVEHLGNRLEAMARRPARDAYHWLGGHE